MFLLLQRSKTLIPALASVCCILASGVASGDDVVQSNREPSYIVTLESAVPIQNANAVTVRVAIRQVTSCSPAYIDSYFVSSRAVGRPGTVVQFDVVDLATGQAVEPGKTPLLHMSGLSIDELVLLDCGRFYGVEIPLVDPEWRYVFHPGKYRIRARMRADVGSYLKDFPQLAKELMQATGMSQGELQKRCRPVELEGDWVELEVK